MDKEDLLKLIDDDPFDLLKLDAERSAPMTEDDRLVASFQEINQFFSQHGHEPKSDGDIQEFQLFACLKGIRHSSVKVQALIKLDVHGLLKKQVKEIKTLTDLFADDNLKILDSAGEDIFNLNHVTSDRTAPDYIASRKTCQDFDQFHNQFTQCQADLTAGRRELLPFKREQTIDAGHFYVLKGILLYVAEIGVRETIGGHTNARLRCIFENGTESNLLLRSLAVALYKEGRRVTAHYDQLQRGASKITNADKDTGFIYILKSLSENQKINTIKNLYKIGFSTLPVEERVKNAAIDPTYLMAQVSILAVYQCYNMNPQKFEQLLHTFFATSCLDVDVFDNQGNRHIPREWFIAPLGIIEQAIQLLISGSIVHYRYDPLKQLIVGR
jgi:hypothetical protein